MEKKDGAAAKCGVKEGSAKERLGSNLRTFYQSTRKNNNDEETTHCLTPPQGPSVHPLSTFHDTVHSKDSSVDQRVFKSDF